MQILYGLLPHSWFHKNVVKWNSCRYKAKPTEIFLLLFAKMQQTKMLVTCERFGNLFLFGLVWQCSSVQKKYNKVDSKSWLITCRSDITYSLPSYTGSGLKKELKFCNGYLSLMYFCLRS